MKKAQFIISLTLLILSFITLMSYTITGIKLLLMIQIGITITLFIMLILLIVGEKNERK